MHDLVKITCILLCHSMLHFDLFQTALSLIIFPCEKENLFIFSENCSRSARSKQTSKQYVCKDEVYSGIGSVLAHVKVIYTFHGRFKPIKVCFRQSPLGRELSQACLLYFT